jgi:hypothetical protein
MSKQKRKQRKYNGNPLAYFNKHFSKYKHKSRGDLALDDPGLYGSLLNAGQLEQAIANDLRVGSNWKRGRKPLPVRGDDEICALYEPNNGNASHAAKDSSYSVSTIIVHWKKRGLKIRNVGGPPLFENEDDEICALYKPNNGNASHAAKNSSYSVLTIINHWRKRGLKIRKKGRPKGS